MLKNVTALSVLSLIGAALIAGCPQNGGGDPSGNGNGDDGITGEAARVYGRVFDASTDVGLAGVQFVARPAAMGAENRFSILCPNIDRQKDQSRYNNQD